jgi:virginiamycin A acetyltransferase
LERGEKNVLPKKESNLRTVLKLVDILLKRPRFTMGAYSYYASKPVVVGRYTDISVGKFCSIGHNVTFVTMGHHVGEYSTYPFGYTKQTGNGWADGSVLRKFFVKDGGGYPVYDKVSVGNDVWIGANVTIIGPCSIGDGAVIGAGSVVRGKVPPYAVVYGNPAVVAYYRFDSGKIAGLINGKWWNKL